jgi:hypothetical protein
VGAIRHALPSFLHRKRGRRFCLQSQIIPANRLWTGFNPDGVKKGFFVLFRGYIDESIDGIQNIFTLSCLIARGKAWTEMERLWKQEVKAKNKELQRSGRPLISRYHASDCSGRHGEFEGWSLDERDRFVIALFKLFKKFRCHATVFDLQLDEVCEVFPEWKKDRLRAGYYVSTVFMMHQIGLDLENGSEGKQYTITLFHDRTGGNGRYDSTILDAFNRQKNEKNLPYKDCFTTIAPLEWERCMALQPADLVAFECMKQTEARLDARPSRKSFKALIDMETFGIAHVSFEKRTLLRLREGLNRNGLLPAPIAASPE